MKKNDIKIFGEASNGHIEKEVFLHMLQSEIVMEQFSQSHFHSENI